MHLPWKLILLGGAGVLGLVLLLLLLATVLHRKQNRSDWASPGLYGVKGRMGAGKSYMLAWCGVQALASGRPVWGSFDCQGTLAIPVGLICSRFLRATLIVVRRGPWS